MTKQQKLEIICNVILLLLFIGVIVIVVYFNGLVVGTLQSIKDSTLITSKEVQMANELANLVKKCIAPVNLMFGICIGLLVSELTKMIKRLNKKQ